MFLKYVAQQIFRWRRSKASAADMNESNDSSCNRIFFWGGFFLACFLSQDDQNFPERAALTKPQFFTLSQAIKIFVMEGSAFITITIIDSAVTTTTKDRTVIITTINTLFRLFTQRSFSSNTATVFVNTHRSLLDNYTSTSF